MIRALLDANVLFPAHLRNVMMHLTLAEAFAARWTAQIHDEWMRNVLKSRPDLTPEALERLRRLMDRHALDAVIEGYEPLMETLTLPDKGDRHILAAAIRGRADVIVTWNLKDFPRRTLERFGIRALSPDAFLMSLWPDQRENILQGLQAQRASLTDPSQTPTQFLESLQRQRLTQFVAALGPHESQLQLGT